ARCLGAPGRAMRGDVDEMSLRAPLSNGVHGARIGLRCEDRLIAVALLDTQGELVVSQPRDAPGELLLVGQLDAKAPAGDLREHVPVVMQRGVDVNGDAHSQVDY